MGIDRYEAWTRYSFDKEPEMETSAVRSFLDEFYTVAEAYVEGDDLATTFASCGAVLLAAVLVETRSAEILASVTGFPVSFIERVLWGMEAGKHCFSLQFADFITAVHLHREDFKKMEGTLDALMEAYWAKAEAQWCDVLVVLRGDHLFGGERQWWIDAVWTPLIMQKQGSGEAAQSWVLTLIETALLTPKANGGMKWRRAMRRLRKQWRTGKPSISPAICPAGRLAASRRSWAGSGIASM
jgi:hypothetical protein